MSKKSNATRQRKQQQKERQQAAKEHAQYVRQIIKEQKLEADRILLRTMKRASKVGAYKPKEFKLTKYRRYKANKILREFGDTLDPAKFFFVKAPKKGRKTVLARGENLQIKTTHEGFLIPKAGYTRAKMKYDKKHKEYFVDVTGKIKHGKRRGKSHRKIIPITTLDELANEKERLINLANKLGKLKANERLAFTTEEQGFQGFSKQTFSNMEQLLRYLEQYKNTVASHVNFFRHITIVKTTDNEWFTSHVFKDKIGRIYKPRRMVHRGKAQKETSSFRL